MKKVQPGTARQAPPTALWPQPGDLSIKCDPYLTWAVASRWRGQARMVQSPDFQTEGQQIRVLLRAESPEALDRVSQLPGIHIPLVYLQVVPGANGLKGRFATATLHPSALTTLLDEKHGVQFELAAAVRDQGGPLKGDAKGYFGQQTDLDIADARKQVSDWLDSALRKNKGRGKQPAGATTPATGTIAVFDYGCPFLRDQYMHDSGSSSRIQWLWHQENIQADGPWKPSPMGQGRVLGKSQLNQLIELARDGAQAADEARIYSGLNYLIDHAHPRRRVFTSTHGAHVLDVVGGSPNPLQPQEPADAASRAQLVFVQMPETTAGDSSAASLGACLLDALRCALDSSPPLLPLVANVSFGTTAGPHDGSSLIEQAMDELLGLRNNNFAVVLAAGNSRHLGLHCQRTLSARHSALFRMQIQPGDRTDTFVEFWYPPELGVDLQFRARLPSGVGSEWVDADRGVDLLSDSGEEVVCSLIHRRHVPNGQNAMMLLALRPTETPAHDDGPLSPPGQWEVEVRLDPKAQVRADHAVSVNAWIKRDDSRPYAGRVQSVFVGLDRNDSENTLNGLATGCHTIVASGFRWSTGMAVDYASNGPRQLKDQLPLIYGLCEWDSVDPGVRASAVRSGETTLMNGTSVAAPVVARQVYNLLVQAGSGGLVKKQLLKELRARAALKGSPLRVA